MTMAMLSGPDRSCCVRSARGRTWASAKRRPPRKFHPHDSKTSESPIRAHLSAGTTAENPRYCSLLALGMDEITVSELQHAGKIERIFCANDQKVCNCRKTAGTVALRGSVCGAIHSALQ